MRGEMCLALLSLLLPVLTISGRIIEEYQNDDYDYNEANYDDGASEEDKESETDRTPKFISSSKTFIVHEGDAIKLPCFVDNLENFLIIWKKGETIVTLGNKPIEDDDKRIQVENIWNESNETGNEHKDDEEGKVQVGNTLVIRLSEEKDAGEYVCQVSSANPVELKHTVKIIVRPAIEPVPASCLLTVSVGETADLACRVTRGDPEPDVYWKRKDKPLPSGKTFLPGSSISFHKTSRHHSGLYTCYADNGWREPAKASIQLDVQHAPEIEHQVMMVQNQGEAELRLICTVHASPIATVEWYKDGQLMGVKDNVISKRGNRHTLLIMGATKDDVTEKFECKAHNALGKASAVLEMPFDAEDNRLPVFKEDTSEKKDIKEKSLEKLETAVQETSVNKKVTASNIEEQDRTQDLQDKKKIPFEQNIDGIDSEKENAEDADKKQHNESDQFQNREEGSGFSNEDDNLPATNLDAVGEDKAEEQNTSQPKVEKEDKSLEKGTQEKVDPVDAVGEDIVEEHNTSQPTVEKGVKSLENDKQEKVDPGSLKVSNPEKLQDIPDNSSSVKYLGDFYFYLILPVIYTLGL
jgi:hypothetical protein